MSRGKSKRSLALIEAAYEILEEIEPASVRAVCYQLFIKGLIPDMSKGSTNSVSRLLTGAREDGNIPWEWIVDESREAERQSRWRDTSSIINAAVRGYRRDYWQEQPNRVEVWSEKGTVRGTLAPVLEEFGITFLVMHGYASATVVNMIADESNDSDKPLTALYVGDWDPSGLHMSHVDLPKRLSRYGADLKVDRVTLVARDLRGLPSFDPESKASDPRHRWFMENIGTQCFELDALPPPALRERVRSAILDLIDAPLWDHARAIERVEVESMQEFSKSWQARISSVPL